MGGTHQVIVCVGSVGKVWPCGCQILTTQLSCEAGKKEANEAGSIPSWRGTWAGLLSTEDQ